ncbi:hypothetical protein [Kineococcus auxinigenes]|uniref:hypothetical protein n=1 Tax=unclassified Kineococcus TaxID=2621656 RepID=UPI003D7DD122
MTWAATGAVLAVLAAVIGWGARRRLDRGSHAADPEEARVAQEISRQIDRGRSSTWWVQPRARTSTAPRVRNQRLDDRASVGRALQIVE